MSLLQREKQERLARAETYFELGLQTLNRVAGFTARAKYDDAVWFFENAAERFLLLHQWRRAGAAFTQCASIQAKVREGYAAASFHLAAARSYRRTDPQEAIKSYEKAVGLFSEVGKFSTAGVIQRIIAELYEADQAHEQAADAYTLAGEYFVGESMVAQAVMCYGRAGRLLALEELYEAAVERFSMESQLLMDDHLLKFNTHTSLLSVALCWMAVGDLGQAQDAIADGCDLCFTFRTSRERQFAEDLVSACGSYDRHKFIDFCWAFDDVQELEPHQLL